MNVQTVTFAVFINAIVGAANAQVRTPTQVVEQGMLAFVKGDEAAAVSTWVNKGTSMPPSQRQGLVTSLSRAKEIMGPVEGYEIVREAAISQRVRILYAVVHYHTTPFFFRFRMYRMASDEWVATNIKADTDAQDIFPPELANGHILGG